MESKFTIEIEYIKENAFVYKELYEENMDNVIDILLIPLKDEYLHLAIWSNPNMNIGEIIILDDAFEQEQYIRITKI
jgi:hypothetical protein